MESEEDEYKMRNRKGKERGERGIEKGKVK